MDWQHVGILTGLGALIVSLGACESALLRMSRSKFKAHLEKTGSGRLLLVRGSLAQAAEGDPAARLTAAMAHSLSTASFILYYTIIAYPPSGAEWPWKIWIILLPLMALMRVFSALLGEFNPERFVATVWRIVWWITYPLRPLAHLSLRLEEIAARAIGKPQEDAEDIGEEKIKAVVSDIALDGVVEEGQRAMIASVFELKDSDVADVFTPRTQMIAIESSASVKEAVGLAMKKGHTRLPVYEETRDQIIGIFHVHDALRFYGESDEKIPRLLDILRPPFFVPETKKINELLKEMQSGGMHMAIVLDEYGGTAGLVTLEDALEEIVGDIRDEYDVESEVEADPVQEKKEGGEFTADGAAHVADINKALGIDVIPEDDDYETIAGFVLANLGHIPAIGESFEYVSKNENYKLSVTVTDADERRIKQAVIALVTENKNG